MGTRWTFLAVPSRSAGLATLLLLNGLLVETTLSGCAAKAPTQELADAQSALRAAREAGADTSSPEYRAAEDLLAEALKNLRDKKYPESRTLAADAKRKAEDLLAKLMATRWRSDATPSGEGDLALDPGSLGDAGEILGPGNSYVPDERLALKRIYFRFDEYSLTDEAVEVARKNAEWLSRHPDLTILIEGHCDERGTNEYNLALGERRAERTRDYLVALGIAPARLRIVSYGEEIPLDEGHTEEAWARNRRVQFVRWTDQL
ncbi:MAG: peptidoglycan-associated lipoprotein Pal [Nitrospirae bacterium]|nr:peptidoglycan-associated lipoprotein Pal [Nitrospirota bacterium]